MTEWVALSKAFSGWTLSEIQSLSRRERTNWLEIAASYGGA